MYKQSKEEREGKAERKKKAREGEKKEEGKEVLNEDSGAVLNEAGEWMGIGWCLHPFVCVNNMCLTKLELFDIVFKKNISYFHINNEFKFH